MKRYVEQLLEDLKISAVNSVAKREVYFNALMHHDYCIVNEEDEQEGGIRISDLIGMEQFVFPKMDYLSDYEAQELTNAMIKVFESHGFNPIFAVCIPPRIKYGMLRDHVTQMVYPEKYATVDIEMCDYLPVHCPYASYCPSVQMFNRCCNDEKEEQ